MSRVALVAGAAAAAVVVAVVSGLALGWWRSGTPTAVPARPLSATTALSDRTLTFGDPVTAELDLLVDPRRVSGVRVRPRFSPYRIVSTTLARRDAGGVLLSYQYALECLSPACVPGRTPAEQRFLPTLVSYRAASGRPVRQPVEWPSYTIVSHLSDADRADPTTRLRADTTLPALTYRIAPGTLEALLTALAVALAVLAAALAALAFRRPAGAAVLPEATVPPLARALSLVRASTANGYPGERRKALGWLARVLRSTGRSELADTAVELAWSAENPSPEAAGGFAAEVEASVGKDDT